MNRQSEYAALTAQLAETPLRLDYTVDRALPRFDKWKKRRRLRRGFGIPLGTLAALCAAFVILVNASPAFAAAARSVSWLAAFTDYVEWNPALGRAADAGYGQSIGQSQTKDGVTITVEGAFSDEKQINLYYTVTTDDGRQVDVLPFLYAAGSDEAHGGSCELGSGDGRLLHAFWDYSGGETPPQDVKIVMQVYPQTSQHDFANAPHSDISFRFTLADAAKTKWTHLGAGTAFTLDGQKFTLTDLAVSPTQTRLYLRADSANTARLSGAFFYLEDESGRRYGEASLGLQEANTLYGPDVDGVTLVCQDSPYFTGSEHLKLCFTGATWLDKARRDPDEGNALPVRVDLESQTAEGLPEGVRFESAERTESGWKLAFSVPTIPGISGYSLFSGSPCAQDGTSLDSSLTNTFTAAPLGRVRFLQTFTVDNYSGTELWLHPCFTGVTVFPDPLTVALK